ncbi:MAG: hypothetical protein FWC40_02730, partial [Proteobacteria bacterium]|nr:hypothetical protein [Pseudomonadota bacterium]
MANDPSRSRHSHDNAYDDGYEQSYGKDDLHDPRAQQCKCDTDELEREYRKSQLLDEFQQERDLIIVSIQSALKTNQYGDAYALVERYRTV